MIPGKTGMEFLSDVCGLYPDMAVVMITAVVDTSTAVKAMREGTDDYVTKPFVRQGGPSTSQREN